MRLPLLLLTVSLALPASAQSYLGLVPGASGAPSTVVSVDAATMAQTPLGSVLAAGTSHPNQPAPVFVDVVGQRAFFVRIFTDSPTGWSLVTADLATGAETSRPWTRPFGGLFGYDAGRDRLLELVGVLDTVSVTPLHVRVRGVLVRRDPATGDTVHVATVARGESTGSGYVGESLAGVSAPAVASADRLVTTTRVGDAAHLASVDLATGAARVYGAAGPVTSVAAVDDATDAVYRTGTRFEPTSDSTWRQRTVLVRAYLHTTGVPPDTLATLTHNTRLADGTWTVTGLAAMGDLAVYDALTDAVLLNVDGRLRTVDLATGAVTQGGPVGDVRFVGRDAARAVATDIPADSPTLALAASPNPASSMVRLALAGAEAARVEAFSVLGRRVALVHDGPLADALTWDTSHLPAGVYVVRATTATASTTLRLTVAR